MLIPLACTPFVVCLSLVYFFEQKMLSSIDPLMSAIHEFHEKNGYFPKRLSDMKGDYQGESTNRISHSGYFWINYMNMDRVDQKWPAIQVRNKNYFYVMDSETGKVIRPPEAFLD